MICGECVKPASIKGFILNNQTEGLCKYCSSNVGTAKLDTVIEFIASQLDKVLVVTDELTQYEQNMVFECGASEPHIANLWDILGDSGLIAEEVVASDIVEKLEDLYGADTLFAYDDGTLEERNDYEDQWIQFVELINHRRRYFNATAEDFLDSLFEVLHIGESLNSELIHTLESQDKLYRARIANSRNDLAVIEASPHEQLGPVPKRLAGNQRMTPAGISAIYCALDRNTCLSEIRAIVGDLVVSGEFTPIQPLKLLDLSALKTLNFPEIDLFHNDYRAYSHAHSFLIEMIDKLSRPLARDDSLGYLSTQVFFEYLSVKYGEQIVGLKFPSVQAGGEGMNVALFPAASGVEKDLESTQSDKYHDSNPFAATKASLIYVNGSLIFHRIESLVLTSKDTDYSYPHVTDELTKKRLGF